jgi:hypothetical protein
MLKPLSFAIAFIPLTLTTPAIPRVDAAIVSQPQESRSYQLIAKQDKSTNVDAQQRAEIASIHQTIGQFYRGMNELNVDRMERASLKVAPADKAYMRRMFDRLKAKNIEMSIEVRSIELVSFSPHNAIVKIDQVVKGRRGDRSTESQQTGTLALLKYRGAWKIADSDTVIKSMQER